MWRIYRGLRCQPTTNVLNFERRPTKQLRLQSTSFNKPKKGKMLLILTGTSIVAVGGVTLYAKQDQEFQTWLTNNLPAPIVDLIGFENRSSTAKVLEKAEAVPKISTSVQNMMKEKESSHPKQEGKIGREPMRETSASSTLTTPELVPGSSSSLDAKLLSSSSFSPPPPAPHLQTVQKRDEALQRRLTAQELDEAAENAALEQILTTTVKGLKDIGEKALTAQNEALKSVKFYSELLERSIDETDKKDAIGIQLNSAALKKKEALKTAESKSLQAKEHLEKLKNAIAAGRESKLTRDNPSLIAAEETLNDLVYKIQTAESHTLAGKVDSKIMGEYCDLVEKLRQDFKNELQSYLPEVKLSEKGKKLTDEERSHLLTHAYRRVDQLQKQLAKQQVSEKQRFQRSFKSQQQEQGKNLQQQVEHELEKIHREKELTFQRKMAQLRDDYEQELRIQLRRQAAAHSDHLQDVLQVQHTELQGRFYEELQEKLKDAQKQFEAGLAKSFARLKGIEEGMTARAEANQSAKMSQALWLACQSLKQAITTGSLANAWEHQLKPLGGQLEAVTKASDDKHPLISVVVNAIPEQAKDRGIYPETALKERFVKVHRVCRRVALVGDQGGSLIRFALSYLQSLLVVDALVHATSNELADQPLDPSTLSVFDILSRAKWFVDRNDLELALRYMNLLKGASRFVADDWMKEVRLTLETRQAADALTALSCVLGVQGFL